MEDMNIELTLIKIWKWRGLSIRIGRIQIPLLVVSLPWMPIERSSAPPHSQLHSGESHLCRCKNLPRMGTSLPAFPDSVLAYRLLWSSLWRWDDDESAPPGGWFCWLLEPGDWRWKPASTSVGCPSWRRLSEALALWATLPVLPTPLPFLLWQFRSCRPSNCGLRDHFRPPKRLWSRSCARRRDDSTSSFP